MILLVAVVGVCLYFWYLTSDFALALVLMTGAFGVIWLIDRIGFRRRRIERAVADGKRPEEPMLVDYARSFFPVILAVLLFRTFLIEPFRIPSGSMMPTLLVGDFVLVNKFAYGLRLPVIDTKIVDIGEPHRGDIVVFKYPPNPKEDYIKRIIGLPGDTITVRDEQVLVNGKPLPQSYLGPITDTQPESVKTAGAGGVERLEKIGNVTHRIIILPPFVRAPQTEGTWKVPQGYYFAMGDNRDNSSDSRFWGPVPEADLRGKAFLIWFSLADLKRIGTILH
jgi:signal peptidase I